MSKKLLFFMLAALLLFTIQVSAQDDVMEMDEVVVTASRYEESIMDTPVSIEVIDEEEIEDSTASNLAELLRDAGGVHIKDNGGLIELKDVIIRGSRGDQLLYLIDGQPYNSPQDGVIRLEDIPISIIKQIEILKSPASSVYGLNALGGVINIITKDAADIAEINLGLGIGSYNTQKLNVSTSYKWENSSFLFSYDNLKTDGHRDDPDQESKLDRNNYFLKYKYDISDLTSINLNFRHKNIDSDYPGSDGSNDYGSRDDQDNNINLNFLQNFETKDRSITLFNQNRNLYDRTRDIWDVSGFSVTDIDIDRRGGSFSETNYKFNKHTINYGIDYVDIKVTDNQLNSNNVNDNSNFGVFIQDKYNLNAKNTIVLGGRYDDNKDFDSEFNPRIGYINKVSANLNFNLSYAESYRVPTFMDLYGNYGNENLHPEKMKSYDLGFKYLNQNCSRELSIFYKDGEEYIGYNDLFELVNIDSVEIKGFEIITDRKLTDAFSIGFNYTYLDAKDVASDEQLVDMPYHKANLSLKYNTKNGKIILNNRFVGERRDIVNEYPYPVEISSSYFISDLKFSNTLNDNLSLSVEINNIFDKNYQVINDYTMPGRNFMVNVSTKF